MKNLIPGFIAEKYLLNEQQGSFTAATMFLDISGFTPMTERLMGEGKEGAEVMNGILNSIFGPVIDVVYDNCGFISTFAGDAFTAIFPDSNDDAPMLAIDSAKKINEIFSKIRLQKTRFGNFELSVKLGLSYGNVDWGIAGSELHKTFFFRGEAVDACAQSEHRCKNMEIVLDKRLLNVSGKDRVHVENLEIGYYQLISIKYIKPQIEVFEIKPNKSVLAAFLPEAVVNYNQKGEFRNIISIFISFKEPDTSEKLSVFVSYLLDRVYEYGGYCEGIDFGDKGGNTHIMFGVPCSYEDLTERACSFICAIINHYGDDIRAGITSGIVFSGIKGSARRCIYGVLGDLVNLSARFMMKADWGSVWIDKTLQDRACKKYSINDLGCKEFKGKSNPIAVFELLEKKKTLVKKFFVGEMVGREKEYKSLQSYCGPINEGKFGGVVYVYGQAGIGKSRLIYEVTEDMKPKAEVFTLQTDGILKQSMNPFRYMLNNYFELYRAKNDEERKTIFEENYKAMLDKLSKVQDKRMDAILIELKRIKSIIGGLMGIFSKGSLYDTLSPRGRRENTIFAIKDFFKAHCLIQPLIILLEDFHWIDSDSAESIRTLTRNIDDFPIIIIATSRINDDGTKPFLALDKEIFKSEINIEYLPDGAIGPFIEDRIGGKPDARLISFIKSKSLGNPFYIEQFCLYLKENKLLGISGGFYRLKQMNVEIPTGINSIIIARIDRLAHELKETVQLASVLGKEVDVNVLFELIRVFRESIEFKTLKEIMLECEREQIWTNFSEMEYIFKHALLRDAVYEMQLRERLRFLHKIVAEIIETLHPDNREKYSEIAYHYDKAENFDKAILYFEKSGDYLRTNYSNEDAIKQYDRLLELLVDSEKEKITAVIKNKALILSLIGKWDDAIELLESGINIAKNVEGSTIGELKCLLGWIFQNRGNIEKAMQCFEESEILANKTFDKKLYYDVLRNIGLIHEFSGSYDKAMDYYGKCKRFYHELGIKTYYAILLGQIGTIHSKKGEYEKAMDYFEEQKQIYLESGNKKGYSDVLGQIGVIFSAKGDYDAAMECYIEDRQICFEIGDKRSYSTAMINIGLTHWEKGEYNKAMECYEEAEQILLELGNKRGISIVMVNMGLIYDDKGEYGKAMEFYEKSKQISLELGDRMVYTAVMGNIATAYRETGEFDKAMENYEEAISTGRELDIKYYLCSDLSNKAKLLFDMGRTDEARPINDEALKIAREIGRKDTIFNATILKHKIDKKIKAIEAMLFDNKDEGEIAVINYELWKLTGDRKFSKEAIDIYSILYQKTPKFDYKKRIEEMKS